MSARILSETAVLYFLQVVNSGSISEAAARLHVVPSAISRQIARLESELDVSLFERQARGMTLTAAGELLAGYARRTLLDAENVINEINVRQRGSTELIKIACTQGFASHCLPEAIARFNANDVNSHFQLVVADASEVTRLVREAQVDIGFCFSLGPEKDINVVWRQPAPLLALLAPSHPLAAKEQVSLHELVGYPLALPGPNSTLRQLLDIYFSREGVTCNPVLATDSLETLVQFAVSGSAITFTGELFVRHRLAAGELKVLTVPELAISHRTIEIQTLGRRQLSPLMLRFITYMQDVLAP